VTYSPRNCLAIQPIVKVQRHLVVSYSPSRVDSRSMEELTSMGAKSARFDFQPCGGSVRNYVDGALNSRQLEGMHLTDYLLITVKYKPLNYLNSALMTSIVQLMTDMKKFKFNRIF